MSELLAELARLDLPATFFLVGRNIETLPDATREIVAAGPHLGL